MSPELTALIVTAASIGLVHTLLGPDHYLPFVALAKANGWSTLKTTTITILCGLGHVLSSVVLGLLGVALGTAVGRLEWIESIRGDFAAWALIAFGLVYLAWGIRRARNSHGHTHRQANSAWVLFIVFVLGPCEPLIPILMYPAARFGTGATVQVAAVFSVVTITTMVGSVLLLVRGLRFVALHRLERYAHAMAGGVILACGIAIQFGL